MIPATWKAGLRVDRGRPRSPNVAPQRKRSPIGAQVQKTARFGRRFFLPEGQDGFRRGPGGGFVRGRFQANGT